MRILLTGGSGQVGTAFRDASRASDLIAPSSQKLDVGDMESVDAAFQAFHPEVVVNCAAYTAVDRAEDEPEVAFRVNRNGPEFLASACKREGAYLIHVSTDYVFDGTKTGAYTESDPTHPQGIYAKSKLAGELAVLTVLPSACIVRVSWVFSETGRNFVKTILRLANDLDELKVVDDQWGTPCSARLIGDMIWRIVALYEKSDAPHGVYHFSTAPRINWHGFALHVVETAQQMGVLTRRPVVRAISTSEFGAKAPRPANSVLDSSRLCSVLGNVPVPDWQDELPLTIQRISESC